ncbi:MAG: kelch repeat-containing protein [Saprospiraceae bacterium]|nr:kelch repeat-containing protein [Saprospiraceae bacterium]
MKHLWLIPKLLGQVFAAFLLTLFLPISCSFAQGTWTQKPDMPFFKNHHSAVASGGKIYLFGGGVDLNSCTNLVHEYEPSNGFFKSKAPMPVDLCGAAAVEKDGKIYLFGGYTTFGGEVSDTALEYNVAGNSWKILAPMPTARGYASAVLFPSSDQIWVIGGENAFGQAGLDVVEMYDLATNTWIGSGNMPFGRGGLTAHFTDYFWSVFVFGGSANTNLPAEGTVWAFDVLLGWIIRDSLPTARTLHSSSQIGDKVFLMGGMTPGESVFNSVDMFDMQNLEWASAVAPMHTARRAFAAAAVDKKIYVFGGNNEGGVLKSVEVFDPGNLVKASEPFAASGAALLQNTPNPFDEETVISFSIAKSAQVDLSIFDLIGRKRLTMVNQFLSPGIYAHRLNAGELETGFYYYQLLLDGFKPEARKMVVVK